MAENDGDLLSSHLYGYPFARTKRPPAYSKKTDFPSLYIAILTSYDHPEYRQAAFQYGAIRFFVKGSLAWDEVETLVKSILPDMS